MASGRWHSLLPAVGLVALIAMSLLSAADAKKLQFTVYEQLVRANGTSSERPVIQGSKVTVNTVLTIGEDPTSARIGAGAEVEHVTRVGTTPFDIDAFALFSLQFENLVIPGYKNSPLKGQLIILGFINDAVALTPQQVPVLGGTKDFVWARGYADLSITKFYPGGHTSKYDITIKLDDD